MPRKRMLYPAFFNSDQIAALSLHAAYTFAGFWCFADDRGRLVDNPEELWAQVWFKRRREVRMEQCGALVDELVAGGQLCRYRVGGAGFLHAVSWDEHQKISHATPSKLPPCADHQPVEWAAWWKDDDTATNRWRQAEKAIRAAHLAALSSPESIAPDSGSTPPQFSSVQGRSDQVSGPGNVRQFVRPSQQREA